MNELQFPGARWWKFDFHTHTPASDDFGDKNVEHESWLKAFMKAKIDCVAITDHNSGAWIDDLKQALKNIKDKNPEWYHPLSLFPGVEISTYDDVHVLAIFGCDKNKDDIDQLLGAVGYSGTKGKSDDTTDKTITEVVNEITKRGGLAIPAHVDQEKGVFKLNGKKQKKILQNNKVYAAEVHDSNYKMPQFYKDQKGKWTIVNGSDTHNLNSDTFGTFTWIKMDEPSIDGLELALRDGAASVNRNRSANPNHLPMYFVENLEISKAKYIGRAEPMNCQFSPFLNTIIGGRGSGKSTLLEFMRLALRRDKDIPEALQKESHKYFNTGDANLLIEDSKISLIYCKGEVRYRLNWSPNPDCPSLEEEEDNGTWKSCDGEIKSRFPVRIYSQKQIFELAKEPSALIEIIDEASEVDAARLKTENKHSVNEYKQIDGKQRELRDKIAEESRLRGESNDHTRQIEQIEKSGHKKVLQNYRERRQQLNELESLERKWEDMRDRLLETRGAIAPADFNAQHFSEHTDILSTLETTNKKWQFIHDKVSELVQEANSVIAEWQTEKNTTDWMQAIKTDMAEYEQLRSELEQQEIDPDRYPSLLTQQKEIQKKLDLITEHQSRQQALEAKKQKVFKEIKENRRALSENRQKFLTSVLQDNEFVSIEVQPFGEDWDDIEDEIRRILQCQDRFDRDIEALKKIYNGKEDRQIEKLKEAINNIRNGQELAKDRRFATHIKSLTPESMIDLNLWFPGDNLKITFGTNRQPIKLGSPGEKAAALLAFILSYGDEPLLLDQPEDDLDNQLIYNLIVEQLRETKSKRQVIIVTHNANIVVNGDAEMVLPLEASEGQTRVLQAASIQKREIREAICNILEGGQQAFEQRYTRIHLGD